MDGAANLVSATRELAAVVAGDDRRVHLQAVVDAEHRGDDITRRIIDELAKSFVVPFDREDIHALAERLDDTVDEVAAAAEVVVLHGVDATLPETRVQCDLLIRAAEAVADLFGRLDSLEGLRPGLDAITAIEREGDTVHRAATAELFSGQYAALEVLRHKDVVDGVERALDAVEALADRVEEILIKHA